MINKKSTGGKDDLPSQPTTRDVNHSIQQLKSLIDESKNIDPNDFESLYRWINATFAQLESFPSEHFTFGLHCLHTGMSMLSIALEKEDNPDTAH